MVKTTINLDTQIYRELVREALEKYGTTKTLSRLINEKLGKQIGKTDSIAKRTSGIWKIKETGAAYTKKLREESEKRRKRWERD